MNLDKNLAPFLIGLVIGLLLFKIPYFKWKKVGHNMLKVHHKEFHLAELGRTTFDTFYIEIYPNLLDNGEWIGRMIYDNKFHRHHFHSNPLELAEDMRSDIISFREKANYPNLIPIDSFENCGGVFIEPEK